MSDDNLSDEDKALFRETMRSVKPLDKTKRVAFEKSKPPAKVRSREPVEKVTTDYNLSNYSPDEVSSESLLNYGHQNIPSKRFRELRNGQIPWQARLDLHGYKPDSASDALCRFIEQQMALEHRCILIIHGKGGRHGEAPILKNKVNTWLRQLPQVLAFHSALPRDGGNGALYVLLKRQREEK